MTSAMWWLETSQQSNVSFDFHEVLSSSLSVLQLISKDWDINLNWSSKSFCKKQNSCKPQLLNASCEMRTWADKPKQIYLFFHTQFCHTCKTTWKHFFKVCRLSPPQNSDSLPSRHLNSRKYYCMAHLKGFFFSFESLIYFFLVPKRRFWSQGIERIHLKTTVT